LLALIISRLRLIYLYRVSKFHGPRETGDQQGTIRTIDTRKSNDRERRWNIISCI